MDARQLDYIWGDELHLHPQLQQSGKPVLVLLERSQVEAYSYAVKPAEMIFSLREGVRRIEQGTVEEP